MNLENHIVAWLRKHVQHKDIGWKEIGEQFTRFQLFKSKHFNIYLHRLSAPGWHPECHDHPWSFLAILLWRGYLERTTYMVTPETSGIKDTRKWPGQILWRPATFAHNVITPYGVSWSLILTGPVERKWGFLPCERHVGTSTLQWQDYRKVYEAEHKQAKNL